MLLVHTRNSRYYLFSPYLPFVIIITGDGTYDVIIICAGCIGASIARELSKSKLSVLVLEAADDITQVGGKFNPGYDFIRLQHSYSL